VHDFQGRIWIVPHAEDEWVKHEPFQPSEHTGLEPVPVDCLDVLGVRACSPYIISVASARQRCRFFDAGANRWINPG
jgi:hypothetical protein